MQDKIKVLFVCLGNICRSPVAEASLKDLVQKSGQQDRFEIESAGTHGYHIGDSPDLRMQRVSMQNGLNISQQRGRQVQIRDFDYFDYIVAMDSDNFSILKSNCPQQHQHKLHKLLDFDKDTTTYDVPDPYYQGNFKETFMLIYKVSSFFLTYINKQFNHH